MTGRHCSDIRTWTNSCTLPSDIPTFAHTLGGAGYEVVLGGRMHFVGPDQRHGFESRIIGDVSSHHPGGRGPNLGGIPKGSTGQTRPAVEVAGPGRTAYQAYDDAVLGACGEYLRGRPGSGEERPLCLVVGTVLPHCPFIAPTELYHYYHECVEMPSIPPGYYESLNPAVQQWRERRGICDLREDEIRAARAGYYGIVEYFDGIVGGLLEALGDAGYADDTVIIYTSDHGESAGENGMWWKSSCYEASAGVPLIVSWPGHVPEGETRSEVVSLVDIASTVADVAGAEPLPASAGQSLLPVARGDDGVAWRDEAFSELCNHGDDPPMRMLRRGPWKLNHYEGFEPQLFNLDEDRHEVNDRADDPACRDVREHLHDRVLKGWDPYRAKREMARRQRDRGALVKWCQTVQPPQPDHWDNSPDVNVFPEE
jgi:choline-sulfatase